MDFALLVCSCPRLSDCYIPSTDDNWCALVQTGLFCGVGRDLADHFRARVGRWKFFQRNAESLADLLGPFFGVRVEKKIDRRAHPIDRDFAREFEQDIFFAIQKIRGAIPDIWALFLEPENL